MIALGLDTLALGPLAADRTLQFLQACCRSRWSRRRRRLGTLWRRRCLARRRGRITLTAASWWLIARQLGIGKTDRHLIIISHCLLPVSTRTWDRGSPK